MDRRLVLVGLALGCLVLLVVVLGAPDSPFGREPRQEWTVQVNAPAGEAWRVEVPAIVLRDDGGPNEAAAREALSELLAALRVREGEAQLALDPARAVLVIEGEGRATVGGERPARREEGAPWSAWTVRDLNATRLDADGADITVTWEVAFAEPGGCSARGGHVATLAPGARVPLLRQDEYIGRVGGPLQPWHGVCP